MTALREADLNTTRQSALNKLVEHAKKIFGKKDRDGCSIVVKPCGAFKEHRNFYATMEKKKGCFLLIVQVDDIFQDTDSCEHLEIFREVGWGECVDENLRLFVRILDEIEFDKKTGRMIPKKHVKSDFDMDQVLSDLWEMEQDLGCCVCHERTDTETKCGHKLCIPCWATHNTTSYTEHGRDDFDCAPKCPMCRADIDCME